MKKWHEYIGCIHAHSTFSDGGGTYPEIIKSAQEANLDFLLMSDHMTLKGKEKGFEGWHDNLFLNVGYEIQDPDDQHHYLAFGLNKTLPSNLVHQEYIKEVKNKGALGIAAHPFEERDSKTSLPGYPPISWTTLEYPEIEVVELWNMMSHWMENTTLKNRYLNILRPRSFSTFPKKNFLQWWDGANMNKKVTAVGSVDVHSKKIKLFGLFPKSIFHYKIMFKSIRTHLLMKDPIKKNDPVSDVESKILKAIKNGNSFISNYKRGDAKGFQFWAETENGDIQVGDKINANKAVLYADLPEKGFCKIVRNGEIFHIEYTNKLELEIPPGIYRLEVEKKNRGWIYTNHINIESKQQ